MAGLKREFTSHHILFLPLQENLSPGGKLIRVLNSNLQGFRTQTHRMIGRDCYFVQPLEISCLARAGSRYRFWEYLLPTPSNNIYRAH